MFGVFDRIVPFTDFFGLGRKSRTCGWGAWELTGRWSYVNLSNSNAIAVATATPGYNGVGVLPVSPNPGRLNDLTLGVNWYWNAYTKVQFNYIRAMLDNTTLGHSNTDIFATRFQIEF
jgi:phosphate-selective porin OprO/OprP